MSYVDLKHLLADLALEAVKHPERAAWLAIAVACSELVSPEQPRVLWRECLRRAATLAAPFAWKPTRRHLKRLITTQLFTSRGDLIVLSPRYLAHLPYLKRQTARLLKAVAELRGTLLPRSSTRRAVMVGVILFNAGLFFECHEWFEGLWKTTQGEAREFYHGIVQVAASFYHYEKGNIHGSVTLMSKGRSRLEGYPDTYLDVDLVRLRAALQPWADHFVGGPRPLDFPTIQIVRGAPRG